MLDNKLCESVFISPWCMHQLEPLKQSQVVTAVMLNPSPCIQTCCMVFPGRRHSSRHCKKRLRRSLKLPPFVSNSKASTISCCVHLKVSHISMFGQLSSMDKKSNISRCSILISAIFPTVPVQMGQHIWRLYMAYKVKWHNIVRTKLLRKENHLRIARSAYC